VGALDAISTLLMQHFFLLITVALIIVKALLIRLSSSKASQMRALLSIPSDLSYITLSFVVAALTRTANGIISTPGSWVHPKADLILLLLLALVVCVTIHWIDDRKTSPRFQTWVASNSVQQRGNSKQQMEFFAGQADGFDAVKRHALLGLLLWFLMEMAIAWFFLAKIVEIFSL